MKRDRKRARVLAVVGLCGRITPLQDELEVLLHRTVAALPPPERQRMLGVQQELGPLMRELALATKGRG